MKKQQRRKYQPMPCFVRHPLPSSSDSLSVPDFVDIGPASAASSLSYYFVFANPTTTIRACAISGWRRR